MCRLTWADVRRPRRLSAMLARYANRAHCPGRLATSNSPQAGSDPSSGAGSRHSIAATSLGVAGRMEGHPNAFSEQTNRFSSPSVRGTRRLLDRRTPPRKCRLTECSPGETGYTLICWGAIAPTLEPSRKTLTTPPSPIAGLRRWPRPRPSRDAARTTTSAGNAGQIRFEVRHSWMVAPIRSSMISEVSPPRIAATTAAIFSIVSHRCVLHRSASEEQRQADQISAT